MSPSDAGFRSALRLSLEQWSGAEVGGSLVKS
jgi:hypothetical protein